jgi:hypothetical protein
MYLHMDVTPNLTKTPTIRHLNKVV